MILVKDLNLGPTFDLFEENLRGQFGLMVQNEPINLVFNGRVGPK